MHRATPLTMVNIRPGVSILSVLRHLNYKPWFALAEFVDNSIQSFLTQKSRITGSDGKLLVDIEVDAADEGRIVIRDNASGIQEQDYARAFRPLRFRLTAPDSLNLEWE